MGTNGVIYQSYLVEFAKVKLIDTIIESYGLSSVYDRISINPRLQLRNRFYYRWLSMIIENLLVLKERINQKTMKFIDLVLSMLPIIAPLLIFAACLVYILRLVALDSVLLIIGSSVALVVSVIYTYAPYYAQDRAITFEEMSTLFTVLGVVSLIANFIFVAGLFLVFDKVVKHLKTSKN